MNKIVGGRVAIPLEEYTTRGKHKPQGRGQLLVTSLGYTPHEL